MTPQEVRAGLARLNSLQVAIENADSERTAQRLNEKYARLADRLEPHLKPRKKPEA